MTFRFLGEARRVDDNWQPPDASHLWRYNLHYFDDLNAVDSESRRAWHDAAMHRWIQGNPVGEGDGWDAYPTSLRMVNWIKHAMASGSMEAVLADSLAVQARYLQRRPEYHLLGNHLFANAKALCFAGLFFEGKEAHAWLDTGLAILAHETTEQILVDGGHFERSTMYHALGFEDVLDLVNMASAFRGAIPEGSVHFVGSWPALASRMGAWLAAMCHPDGEISFFNDAAIGIAPPPAELFRYARDLGIDAAAIRYYPHRRGNDDRVWHHHLAASGYIRAEVPDAALFLDVAPIGPDHLPGHAHADTLSFEFSVGGRRVIVNSGTSRYGKDAEREKERGTPAHSTVTIDDANSSEVWGGFRVARRAHPIALNVAAQANRLTVSCGHDGYQRLPEKPIHFRRWELQAGKLVVEDRIEGRFSSAVTRFHLHPDVQCSIDASGNSGRFLVEGGIAVIWSVSEGKPFLEDAFYCPEFGRRDAAKCLVIPFGDSTLTRVEFVW